jgi:hypothetical protein
MPTSTARNAWLGLALLVALIAAGLVWWWPGSTKEPDMLGVLRANNRGVGYMERFDYDSAIQAFEEVNQLAPKWLPGKINLGIALLNTQKSDNLARAIQLFNEILQQDGTNPHAHFCLGIIFREQGKIDQARPHFQAVTTTDPNDAHAWYYLGATSAEDEDLARKCFEKAVQCDPYLRRALYGLQVLIRSSDPRRANEYLRTMQGLNQILGDEKTRYGEMGHYAEALGGERSRETGKFGPLPLFRLDDTFVTHLKAGTSWATSKDLGTGSVADLRRSCRDRFGATMVVLDFNKDGKPDLFLLGAVVEDGKVRDLLLRNDGTHFTDVTHEVGLAEPRLSLGCTAADFDNDGTPDLFITGVGRQWLFRNTGARFEDVTARAGLDKLTTVCLGACFVDLDQDGDLDLVVAQYAENAEQARTVQAARSRVGLAVYLNVGEAKAVLASQDPPPLNPQFKRIDTAPWIDASAPVVGLAASDLDHDNDVDLVVLSDGRPAAAVVNDRLLRLRNATVNKALAGSASWNGALVLDANHDGRSDLFLVRSGEPPVFLLSKKVLPEQRNSESWFEKGPLNSPALLHAQAVDLDYDGWTDVVGLSKQRLPALLHNEGGKLVHVPEALGADKSWPENVVAVAVAAVHDDKFLHLLVWSESKGLQVYRNHGNDNRALKLAFAGHRRVDTAGGGEATRCNADGFGVRVAAQTEDFWTGAEYTTLSAGLGQSRQPLYLGLGKRTQADVVRLRWPDNCWQAELNQTACHVIQLEETNRKQTSCPLLFAWDGRRFGFVADFLGAGDIGEAGPDARCRAPRPEESIKIEAHQLMARDGSFILKAAEPMDEITYLDHLELTVVDHPPSVRVYPDERFVLAGPQPTQDLLAFRSDQEIYPVRARDHKGRDVTGTLRHWDRATVDGFARRAWTGFAEEHWVELDFGDRLSRFGPSDRLVLCLAGWTDYPYPESVWAAHQAGISLRVPVLERLGGDGNWQMVAEGAGFPAGLPRMATLEVTGKLTGPRCTLRLRTNMHVFWDQIFVAPIVDSQAYSPEARTLPRSDEKNMRTTVLPVHHATLEERGCMQEFSPDGRQPTLYDYHRLERVPVTRQSGRLTRFGDVTELLQAADDRFVIFGPGDEVTIRFDARKLPGLPSGWTRSFVLRTRGYCKGCGPFIVTGDTVAPLPFRAMTRFPYGPNETYPRTQLHLDYLRRYNTREIGIIPK